MASVRCPKCSKPNHEFSSRCSGCGTALPFASEQDPDKPKADEQDSEDGPGARRAEAVSEGLAAQQVGDPLVGLSLSHYHVLERLGAGGMGVVYKAEDLERGGLAALKTITAADAKLLPGIRREIRALSRLTHPGIVRILGSGVHEAIPWYAMELIEGSTLRHHGSLRRPEAVADEWWTRSLERPLRAPRPGPQLLPDGVARAPDGTRCAERAAALPRLLTLMRRLCEALAYLHGEGIVHGDLKPDNVMVRPDGWPVLVDFGLSWEFAGLLGRDAVAVEAAAAGTIDYMAPEQIRGEALDARADLYALGCMLYELLTGLRPFAGPTRRQVIEGHLNRPPPRPSEHVPGLAAELDTLVLRLLCKSARQRVGHADVVAAALAELGAEDSRGETAPQTRAYLCRPSLAGREQALRRLRERLAELGRGAGGLMLVSGESGVGKTRLVVEAAREAPRQGLQVLSGECLDRRGRPLEALSKPLQGIADHCRAHGEKETERVLGRRGKVLALYEPALGGLPGQERHAEPAEWPAAEARLRLYGDLAETLVALTEPALAETGPTSLPEEAGSGSPGSPLLLILDDLQWADELTLGFLEFLLRTRKRQAPQATPLLVLATCRREEVGAAGQEALQGLLRSPDVEHLALDRLEEPEVGSMVGDMLALEPPPRLFVRYLARQSEGNPFFVAEYLRAAVDERLLWRDAQGRWQIADPAERKASEEDYAALRLPGSVRELVGRRLQGLSGRARRLLEAAAVLGREADVALAAGMTRMDEAQLDEAMNELLHRQVLETPGPELMRFAHDKIREVAYDGLRRRSRRALHRAAAKAIEAQPARERARPLAALAYHWEQAGQAADARRCYLAAVRQARSRHALGEAERLFRAYLRLAELPTLVSIRARYQYGSLLQYQGRNTDARLQYERTLQEAQGLEDRSTEAISLAALANLCRKLGEPARGRELFGQALLMFRELGERDSEGIVLNTLGLMHLDEGCPAPAQPLFQQALALFRESGDRRCEALALNNLGLVAKFWSRLEEAAGLFQQAATIHQEVRDEVNEALALSNLGVVHLVRDDVPEACVLFERALSIQRRIGDRATEATTLANVGGAYLMEGSVEQARAALEQALAIKREVGHRRFEAIILGKLAGLERRVGRFGAAESLLAQAGPILTEVSDVLHRTHHDCERGHLRLARGQAAGDVLDEAQRLAATLQMGPETDLGQAVAALRRAVEANEAGEHHRLFRGELIESLPDALRRRFSESGELGGEPEQRGGKRHPGEERGPAAGEGEHGFACERPRATRTDPSRGP